MLFGLRAKDYAAKIVVGVAVALLVRMILREFPRL
jgi:hypothetical protein